MKRRLRRFEVFLTITDLDVCLCFFCHTSTDLSGKSTLRLGGHGFDPVLERKKKVPIASLPGTQYLSLTQ